MSADGVLTERTTMVGRLRVTAPPDIGPSAMTAAKTAVERAELRPAGLASGAVLVVRRLAGPKLDGQLGTTGWRHFADTALDRLLAEAARPTRGPVPADANAVLFADRAELLAALAADWLDGVIGTHWWWLLLRRGRTPAALVAESWCAEARYVPAALGLLAGRRRLGRFARVLDDGSAVEISKSVAHAYGRALELSSLDALTSMAAPNRSTPWAHWASEAGAYGLTSGQRVLVGIGLALHRAPAAAVRSEFWTAVDEWCAHAASAVDAQAPADRVPPLRSTDHGRAVDEVLGAATQSADEEPRTADRGGAIEDGGEDRDITGVRELLGMAESETANPGATSKITAREPDVVTGSSPFEEGVTRPNPAHGRTPDDQDDETTSADAGSFQPEEPVWWSGQPDTTTTELGGLFYLVNVALSLRLYSDFAAPRESGIELHPFDLVTLLGRELLTRPGLLPHRDLDDPIWTLLATLAGRDETEPPDRGFRPPKHWRPPSDWLEPLAATGILVHPRHPETTLDPLRGWVSTLAGYVLARLRLTFDSREPIDPLLRQPARVRIRPAHLDVTYELARLPIEVRLAGLDRDPGWVPAAGRTITFHFD